MDSEPPHEQPAPGPAQPERKQRANPNANRPKARPWSAAIPAERSADPLEVAATLGFVSLVVALEHALTDPGIKMPARVNLISKLNAQINAAIPKRRLWEAEQLVKGNRIELEEMSAGPQMETRNVSEGATVERSEGSRPTPRRGRPRTR